ncbi:MAG: DNA polymerase IV, partial [Clostridia bacterium]|nr:DNA polymerase IV [Clostridia bacterium]
CSNEMYSILCEYSGVIQRYSVDECFLDYTASEKKFGDAVETADLIRRRIKDELGFTVNIGVSTNKILAKMGSELKKPNRTHTLWPEEIPEKMWPLPCGELFMVGRATERKLKSLGISTIGELANADRNFIRGILKSHGDLVWRYANGIDPEPVIPNSTVIQKGVGNSMTIKYDVTDPAEAKAYLLSLAERVAMRLRHLGCMASRVSLWIRTFQLMGYRHQVQLDCCTDITSEIYETACFLFDELWRGEPIRQLGIGTGNLSYTDQTQISFFSRKDSEICRKADKTVDIIRNKFGNEAIFRGTFANTSLRPVEGGVNDGNFLNMGGYGP